MFIERILGGHIYIIAEMSANHAGNIENAYRIIEGAAEAGADCVKVQTYTADTLTIDCDRPEYQIHGGLWDGYSFYQLYQKAAMPWEWQPLLKKRCEECGMDFLSTPFDRTAVDYLEEMEVACYKVASYELVDIPLIEYIASKGKPILMSVGMGDEKEIEEAIAACELQGNPEIVLLKCCSEYPARFENMNLRAIPLLKERFGKNVGLSDHSPGSLAPVIAVSLGASVIEKHVCISREIRNPDAGFSMELDEFGKMVHAVRDAETILGAKTLEPTETELTGRSGRRSLVAVKPIKKGEVFAEDNIRSIRPAIGIKPKYYQQLIGKTASKDYAFGEPIQQVEICSQP